jgi:hypothetical protein
MLTLHIITIPGGVGSRLVRPVTHAAAVRNVARSVAVAWVGIALGPWSLATLTYPLVLAGTALVLNTGTMTVTVVGVLTHTYR